MRQLGPVPAWSLAILVAATAAATGCRDASSITPPPPDRPAVARIEPTPGCHADGLGEGTAPPAAVSRSVRPVPFLAARPGALPPTGRPMVGGVRLPRGSRCGPFWSTDAGVPDAFDLARRLAAVFPRTGLWPVLWVDADEEPDGYYGFFDGPAPGDRLDAETLLRRSWRHYRLDARTKHRFPGLAAGRPVTAPELGAKVAASLAQPPPVGGWTVMLVPVTRPADVLRVLGPRMTEVHSDTQLSTVLRSWEERFSAVVVALSPVSVELAIGAPPQTDGEAWRAAAEYAAFAPEGEGVHELAAHARDMRSPEPGFYGDSRDHWIAAWMD